MVNNQNPNKVWDLIWKDYREKSIDELNFDLIESKKSNTWKYYTSFVNAKFGGWKNVISIELGSGMGGHSLMAASEGATVYLLDYSEIALENAKKRFELLNLEAKFIFGNAFNLDIVKNIDFNLSWSFGTAEHFSGEIRQEFFELHFNYLIDKGIAIISCPYKYAINYRIWMHYAIKFNEWDYGLEVPYTKREYLNRLNKTNNRLLDVYFDRGRPCLNKALKILKNHSKLRYYTIGYLIKIYLKIGISIPPFYYRSIILIAEKNSN